MEVQISGGNYEDLHYDMISQGTAPWSHVTRGSLNQKINFIGETLLCKKRGRISGHPVFALLLYLLYFDFEQAKDHD